MLPLRVKNQEKRQFKLNTQKQKIGSSYQHEFVNQEPIKIDNGNNRLNQIPNLLNKDACNTNSL